MRIFGGGVEDDEKWVRNSGFGGNVRCGRSTSRFVWHGGLGLGKLGHGEEILEGALKHHLEPVLVTVEETEAVIAEVGRTVKASVRRSMGLGRSWAAMALSKRRFPMSQARGMRQ